MPKVDVIQSLPCYLDNEKSPYGIACLLFTGRIVRDRFNKLNAYSQFNWIDTVDPIIEPSSTPIAELMDKRAVELIKKGSITVQWSGGVDSSALLLALIKNGIAKEDLLIFYDQHSISEYPKLFNWLVENKYSLKEITKWKKELTNTDTSIITNGWCADQLFGSMFFKEGYRQYFLNIPDFLSSIQFSFGKLDYATCQEYTNIYKDAAKSLFNLDLSIAAELGWFINFTMKWTWVSAFNELYLINTKNMRKTHVFYNTDYFQAWALNNFNEIKQHNVYGKKAQYYKQPLKEYCNSIFKDDDFLLNKSKVPSWNASQTTNKERIPYIVIKKDKGYDLLSVPFTLNPGKFEALPYTFFTSYKK